MARNAATVAVPAAPHPKSDIGEGYWQIAWKRLRKHRMAMAGLFVIFLLVLMAVLAPWIAPYRFEEIDLLNRFVQPFVPGHVLGTDDLGHDVLTRLIYASGLPPRSLRSRWGRSSGWSPASTAASWTMC